MSFCDRLARIGISDMRSLMPQLVIGKVLKKKGISKRQFAKMLGIDYANVFRMFRPTYNPTFAKLCLIATLLECRIRDLIKE